MKANIILQGMIFSSLLLAVAYTDTKKREIPDRICMLITLTSLLKFSFANLSGVFIALPFLLIASIKEDRVGGGDIKLTAAVGTVLGFWKGIYGLIIGLALLVMFYIMLVVINKIRKRQAVGDLPMPLAPFLGIGFIIIYFIT